MVSQSHPFKKKCESCPHKTKIRCSSYCRLSCHVHQPLSFMMTFITCPHIPGLLPPHFLRIFFSTAHLWEREKAWGRGYNSAALYPQAVCSLQFLLSWNLHELAAIGEALLLELVVCNNHTRGGLTVANQITDHSFTLLNIV